MNNGLIDTFSNRLEKAMRERNIKPVELHEKTGLSESLISKYLSGNAIARQDKISILADTLKINPVWLLGYDVSMNKETKPQSVSSSNSILVYGTIPAGIPLECIEDILDTEEISTDMLKGGKQYFGLQVKGNSMNPDYLDGDTLILLKQDDCESGDDCVVMVNGDDGTFKRVIKNQEAHTIRLQPLNTSLDENGLPLYEPRTFTEEEIQQLPVRILGIVVEIRRKKKRK